MRGYQHIGRYHCKDLVSAYTKIQFDHRPPPNSFGTVAHDSTSEFNVPFWR